jgi:hypothetical protein
MAAQPMSLAEGDDIVPAEQDMTYMLALFSPGRTDLPPTGGNIKKTSFSPSSSSLTVDWNIESNRLIAWNE